MSDPKKTPGGDLPDFLNVDPGGGPSKPQRQDPKAGPAKKPAPDKDLGAAGELLMGSSGGQQKRVTDADIDEPFEPERKSWGGIVTIVLMLAVVIGGIVFIMSNDKFKQDIECFFSGEIEKCKTAEKKEQEGQWREIDQITVNRYGSTTITYSPQDARVKLTQLKWKESIDDYMGRVKQGREDKRGEAERIDIPNRTSSLKEKEIVDNLPLQDLPLLEKSTDAAGPDTEVYTYAYEITIEKDGYYPRSFLFMTDDIPMKAPDGVQPYKWENTGPGVFMANFGGCDLMPKPETARPKMIEALVAIKCLKASPEGKKMTPEDLDIQVMSIKQQKGFVSDEFWTEVEKAIRAMPPVDGKDPWVAVEEEVTAGACE